MTLMDDYFVYQIQFEKKYGKRTLVLMEVGSFFEFYGVDNDQEKIGEIQKIAELLNIQMTRRNKAILENDRSNCLMAGFPSPSLKRFLTILLANQYTIVLIEQVTPPPNPERQITQIYSPSTYIEEINSPESRNIVSVYVEQTSHHRTGENIILMGACAIDPSSGKTTLAEIHSLENRNDHVLLLEELYRFIEAFQPREIIIHNDMTCSNLQTKGIKKNDFEKTLNLERRIVYYRDISQLAENVRELSTNNRELATTSRESAEQRQSRSWGELSSPEQLNTYKKISYQQEFYRKIYGQEKFGLLSPIEALGLERFPHISIAFLYLLNYLKEHNEKMIQSMELPHMWEEDKIMRLHHNTIYQLNLIANFQSSADSGNFRCLFDVINHTSTAIGNRLLKDRMLQPIRDVAELERRYHLTEIFMEGDRYKKLKQKLSNFIDLERAFRKWMILMLQPHELASIYYTIQSMIPILTNTNDVFPLSEFGIKMEDIEKMGNFGREIDRIFMLEEMSKCNLLNMKNFYQRGIIGEIDQIQDKIVACELFFDSEKQKFHKILNDSDLIANNKKSAKKKLNQSNPLSPPPIESLDDSPNVEESADLVRLESTDRDGYFFTTSNRRADIIRDSLSSLTGSGTAANTYEFKKHTASNTKIVSKAIHKQSYLYLSLGDEMATVMKRQYQNTLSQLGKSFSSLFLKLIPFIGELDVAVSSASVAHLYHYTKPIIDSSNSEQTKSYFQATELRHPIVERIQKDTFYVTNDISLGNFNQDQDQDQDQDQNPDGILLFGMNGAGKSTIMKAIGLAVIMAQMGLFVPCSRFVFKPYHTLFTRICGEDNIFKGQSSFAVEMMELRSILRYSNKNSLVIGDEICRGTEDVSGLSIVVSAIERFCSKKVSFILATHLHKLRDMEHLQQMQNLSYQHLQVEFNEQEQSFTYGRKLQPGAGSSLYGIEVAKYILQDRDFISRAFELRRQLEHIPNVIMEMKTSKYNSTIYVDHCEICGKTAEQLGGQGQLDVHHILFQQCFREGLESHIQMNEQQNLVVLCKEHHQQVHQKEIEISGYQQTSNGRVLQWRNLQSYSQSQLTPSLEDIPNNSIIHEINEEVGKISRKKFNQSQIDIIMQYINYPNKKLAVQILQDKHHISASLSTLQRVWKGTY
jgi:DNA mismatch repair protein MutS